MLLLRVSILINFEVFIFCDYTIQQLVNNYHLEDIEIISRDELKRTLFDLKIIFSTQNL
jgi:hypothetical protein